MKTLHFTFLLTIFFNACSTHQRETPDYRPNSPSHPWSEKSDMIESRVVKTYIVSKSNMRIKGLCFVETKTEREPCENITIHLIGNKNNSRLETVTDEIGSFTFIPPDRNPQNIEIVSSRYKLKAGKVAAQAGSQLTIILIKK